jgi:hypothetical protein
VREIGKNTEKFFYNSDRRQALQLVLGSGYLLLNR